MSPEQLTFEIIKIVLAIAAAAFAYFKFFREGTHRQRIEFDIDYCDLGFIGAERAIEFGCIAENKGNVEQRFDGIRVTIRGIENGPLSQLKGHEPRLEFPVEIARASLVTDKWQYYFVRPKVKQRFPLVVNVPQSCSIVWVRATFKYQNTDDIHSAERAFRLPEIEA